MDKLERLNDLEELNKIGRGIAEATLHQHEALTEIASLLQKLQVLEQKLLDDLK